MKIGVVIYGGLGDQLLANRFVPSVLEAYDIDKVDIIRPYVKTPEEHSDIVFLKFIKNSFHKFYNEIRFCKKTNLNSFPHDFQCSTAISDFEGFEEYDKVYNFVPDNLYFLRYNELPINKYYNFFPKPHSVTDSFNKKDYIFFHPVARDSQHFMHKLPIEYSKEIVNIIGQKYKVICPVSKDNLFLKSYCDEVGLEYYECNLDEMWSFAKNCKAAICCDSGPKYFPMHFDKLVFVITGIMNDDFLKRWLLVRKNTLPMFINPSTVLDAIEKLSNSLDNRIKFNYHQ